MPHGRRSDRINRRDLEVLEFIARFGIVPRDAVAIWTGAGRSVGYLRERRLRTAGLIVVEAGFRDGERLLRATRAGLGACGKQDLVVARLRPATLNHECVAARLGACLEVAGERVLSEREILARERGEGARLFSAAVAGGRFHRPDMVRVDRSGKAVEAIEVELTVKGASRLDELLRAWRRVVGQGVFGGVTYLCPPRTRDLVERAVERTKTQGVVSVEQLGDEGVFERYAVKR